MENLYETYSNTICRDVPIDYLKRFILTFIHEASQDMGCDFDKEVMPERVLYIISTQYNNLPLMLVASAFKKGALGQYGPGRLVPRTVYGWLGEMNQYYITIQNHKELKNDRIYKFDGLEKYPLGKAICKKIDWLKSGAITSDDWDKISLKTLAEIIGAGHEPSLEYFGIDNLK
jgi:hypothetical protein